jgi:hypothetical protein
MYNIYRKSCTELSSPFLQCILLKVELTVTTCQLLLLCLSLCNSNEAYNCCILVYINKSRKCRILSFHSGGYEEFYLWGYNTDTTIQSVSQSCGQTLGTSSTYQNKKKCPYQHVPRNT